MGRDEDKNGHTSGEEGKGGSDGVLADEPPT